MSKTNKKRALALFLCAALTVSQMGITAFAEEAVPLGTGTQQEHPQEAAAQSGTDESTGDYGKVKTATDSDAAREHTQHWDNGKNAAQSLEHGGSVSTPSNAGHSEKEPAGRDGTVTKFTPLDKGIQKQEAEPGTALKDLVLPDRLEVSVYSEDEVAGSDSVTVGQLEVLKWNSTPDYTGEPGTYVFTPKLAEDYPLRDGVKAPEITVTVKGAASNSLEQKILHWSWAGDNTENLSDSEETGSWEMNLPDVSEKNQASFDNVVSLLPDKIAVTTEQAAADSSAAGKTELTLSGWNCQQFHQDEDGHWPIQGEYIFTASLPEGYVLAPDAKLLEVKVVLGGANMLGANIGTAGDFTVTGQSTGYSYNSTTKTLTIVDGAELTIQNTQPDTSTTDKIVVANGATADITLDGVNIDMSNIFWANALDVTGATVTLNLEGENTLISGNAAAGVLVPENSALTINGTGKLTVRGGQWNSGGAGIGANRGGTCGSITIKDGKVDTMAMEAGGAGIGLGGWGGHGGSISISGGRVISAGGGEGSFTVSDAANIKITGGIVETPKDTRLSDEANVTKENCIIFENHNGQVYGTFALTAGYTVPAGDTLTLLPGTALNIGQNAVLTINGILLNRGTVTGTLGGIGRVASNGTISPSIPPSLSPPQQGSGVIDVNEGKAVLCTNWYLVGDQLYGYDASKGITLTGTTNTNTVTVQSGSEVDVKLDNVDIENTNGGACSFALLGDATCHLTLADDSTNTLKSGGERAGLQVEARDGKTAKLVIEGSGKLIATGGASAAGIGGSKNGHAGIITINSGIIIAAAQPSSGDPAGIGGGGYGDAGTITINGGTVTATGSQKGIGNGSSRRGGSIAIKGGVVTANGIGTGDYGSSAPTTIQNAVVFCTDTYYGGINKTYQGTWNGMIFEKRTGTLYGNVAPTESFEIPNGDTLTIGNSNTLTVGSDKTLTNDGTIKNGGTIQNNGTINNTNGTIDNTNGTIDNTNGIIINNGTITGNPPKGGTVQFPSAVTVSFSNKNGDSIASAAYGDTITITAKAEAAHERNMLLRSAPINTVDFYLGGVDGGIKLGTSHVTGSGNAATLIMNQEIWEKGGMAWTMGENTITADFGGTDGSSDLAASTGTGKLTVTKAVISTPGAPTQPESNNKTFNSITINTVSGQKYICTTSDRAPGIGDSGWIDGTGSTYPFASLTRNTAYFIWTYTVAADANHSDSTVSTALSVTTEKEPISSVNVTEITAPVANGTPDESAANGGYWTAGPVTWDQDGQPHTGSFAYGTAYTANVTLTAADGYQFVNSTAAQVNGMEATAITNPGGETVTVSYTFPATVQQTPAPFFENAFYQMPDGAAVTVVFTITNPVVGTYKLYHQPIDGSEVDSEAAISVNGNILTLTFTNAPAADKTYYVSAADADRDEAESLRTAITVKAYVPATAVSLNKSALSLETGGSETLTATVMPENATNRTVTWESSVPAVATVDAGGKVTAVSAGNAVITASAADGKNATCSLTVAQPSGGSGGSHSDDSGSSQTDITTPAKPDTPAVGTVTVISQKPDQNGAVPIPDGQVAAAISQAEQTALPSGQAKNGVAIAVNLPAAATGAALDRTTLDRLISTGVKSFKLNFDGTSMSFDLPALKEIVAKTTGTLTFGVSKAAGLTGDALAAIGARPAYHLTVSWQADGQTDYLSSFGSGYVSVDMAYTPAGDELTGSLYAVYVDGNGKVEWMDQSSYDRNSKAVIVQTGHFSTFGVGYKTPPIFTDTQNHWAKADIDFVAARGLLTDTGNNQFSTDAAMTRAMFVTALGRLANVNPDSYKIGKFTDVEADAYYAPYVNWAAEKGIVNGINDAAFAPDQAVTRQEMAAIMANYAKACGDTVPKARKGVIFADNSSIAGWARDAVNAMQMAGVMNGRDGNRFDPTVTATRAEAAAVLHRYVELVIDPATAQGWAQNDAGQWLYYEDGIPFIGWKQVDGTWYYLDSAGIMQSDGWRQIGSKWYYFYADGSMAVSTSIDGHEIGPDGARKE